MDVYTFGELLTTFRKQHRISQNELAEKLDVHRNTIGRWERGTGLPESKTIVLELAKQLHLNTNETQQLLEASLTAASPHWLMPYQRNPFFTGRTSVLQQLHNVLAHERSALLSQSYSLSGLGGVGKTQTAIEYAYRYANEYSAVFWISAETNENIVSSFVAIAELLNLPEKQEKEQSRVIAAVTHWLISHSDWLLIFDNVEDLELVKGVLPPARCGSLLFTSRRQALGFAAKTLDMEQMTTEEGVCFLLHRARLLDPTASLDSLAPHVIALAREIVAAMDGLPLALDQAGAYIEETKCILSDYLHLFQSSRLRLLDERDNHADHPSSVTRTFALAFAQLQKNNPAAAELLKVCAFLAPDAIPETFFIEGATHLGPTFEALAADPLQFNAAIKALLTYSLIQRNATTQTLTIHRLVQVVLKESLEEAIQHIWEVRVIHSMGQLLPREKTEDNYWEICERLIPHALVCIVMSEQWNAHEVLPNASALMSLISRVATYLSHRARYTEAESLYQRALQMGEETQQTENPLMAEVLHGLARLYREQGKYKEAQPLYQRALVIREQVLGGEHPLVSETLNELANLYQRQGKFKEAEPLYQRAIRIREQVWGEQHAQLASPLYNLAELYRRQGRYEEAEPLYHRSLSIGKQAFGPEHAEVGHSLNGLANFYFEQDKDEMAEPLYLQALHIWEQALGLEHPYVAYPLVNLGELYSKQSKYEQAEFFYQRGLHIWEQALGTEHPHIAAPIQGLAQLYTEQGKYKEAKPLYLQALSIQEKSLGGSNPDLAETLHHFAHFHELQHQNVEALELYQQALTIREQALGLQHPKTNTTRTAFTHLLRELGRIEEAETVEAQVETSETSSL